MLTGIRVISFTHFLQGPACTQILADLGADVIKIEPPGGAWERHWSGVQTYLNDVSVFSLLTGRNQRSLSLDLRSPEGKEIAQELVKSADVLVENYRPGVLDKLGLGPDEVAELNPRLVYCSLSGYGSSGPYRDKPGQDLLIQAMSGMTTLTGSDTDPPTPVGTAIIDQHAAALGALGVIAALYGRGGDGKGIRVESNLLNAALDLQIEPFGYHINGGKLYDRSSSRVSTRFHQAPYGIFETADGFICVSLAKVEELAALFEDDTLASWTNDDQFERREELNRIVAERLRTRSTEHWLEALSRTNIWFAPVRDYDDVESDPQVEWNGAISTFEHDQAGTVRVLSHPIRYDGKSPEIRSITPQLGEQSEEILSELGYSPRAIQELVRKGTVVSSKRPAAP